MRRIGHSGATLIESLIVMVILTTVLAISGSLFAMGTRVFSRETIAVVLQEDLVGAKNMILDDLSVAGYRPDDLVGNSAGAFATLPFDDVFDVVDPGGATSAVTFSDIDFRGDVGSDGVTDRICYRLASGELRRRVIPIGDACSTSTVAEELLLSNVTTFAVQVLRDTRAAMTKGEVEAGTFAPRFAQVTIALQSAVKGGTVSRTARGETAIRN